MPLPGPGEAFFLVPQCAQELSLGWYGDDLVPVLRPISDRSPSQRWTGTFTLNAPIYDNPAATGILWWGYDFDKVLALGQPNTPAIVKAGVEANGTDIGSWNLSTFGEFFGFQYFLNTDQNLNVAGDGPYPAGTSILGWSWGGGAPNELWKFVPFD